MWDKIKEKYKSLKLELFLMGLFVLVFLLLNGQELAREAVSLQTEGQEEVAAAGADGAGLEETTSDPVEAEDSEESESGERESDGRENAVGSVEEGRSDSDRGTPGETAAEESEAWPEQPYPIACLYDLADFGRLHTYPAVIPEVGGALVRFAGRSGYGEPLVTYGGQNGAGDVHILTGEGGTPAEYADLSRGTAYRPLSLLERMVENRISGYDGDWSVYVRNLSTDESFVVNDRPMKSASVMKLFVMGAVYRAIEAGTLARTDEVGSLMNLMITESDNAATNRLLYLLGNSSYADGIAEVDRFIRDYGFSDMTVEYNGFNDSATVFDTLHSNQVSAKDCGKLLEDVYRRNWMNRATANEIEELLLGQKTRYKIPAGLPDGVLCGNKTGEMETTENDAAIVYAEDCDYILVVLSSDWGSKDQAISRIASLSGMVYEFLN